jgi:hypothetical protein
MLCNGHVESSRRDHVRSLVEPTVAGSHVICSYQDYFAGWPRICSPGDVER